MFIETLTKCNNIIDVSTSKASHLPYYSVDFPLNIRNTIYKSYRSYFKVLLSTMRVNGKFQLIFSPNLLLVEGRDRVSSTKAGASPY